MFKKPPYVFLPAAEFLAEVITHREGEERSKWVTDFAIQLAKGKGKDSFAQELLIDSARKLNENNTRTRRSRAKAELIAEGNKNPSRAEINERMVEMYGEDEDITAAATTSDGVDESTTGCDHYDQEAIDKPTISANSPAGAGVNLDSTQTIKRPDASSGNAEVVITNGSTITRNGSRAACTSATSGQTISATEALEQPGEGGTPGIERTSSSLPSPTPVKPKTDPKPTMKAKAEVKPEEQKYPHGEFENVMLTTDEYVKLCERLDDADGLIAEADQYFEAQPDKKKKYKSHYAMILSWDRRRKEAESPKRGYKTAAEKQRDELRKIADYYASKEAVG